MEPLEHEGKLLGWDPRAVVANGERPGGDLDVDDSIRGVELGGVVEEVGDRPFDGGLLSRDRRVVDDDLELTHGAPGEALVRYTGTLDLAD